MPPLQLLNQTPLHIIIHTDRPFPATDFHFAALPREMELREEDFCEGVLCGRFLAVESECKGSIAEVEAVRGDASDGGDRARADVGFCGSVTGVAGQVCGGGCRSGGDGGSREGRLDVLGIYEGVGIGGLRLREGGRSAVQRGGRGGGRFVRREIAFWMEGKGFVVNGKDREVFAVPEISPLMIIL